MKSLTPELSKIIPVAIFSIMTLSVLIGCAKVEVSGSLPETAKSPIVITSAEVAQKKLNAVFQATLGRQPTQNEVGQFSSLTYSTSALQILATSLLNSSAAVDQMVTSVVRVILGRQPTQDELKGVETLETKLGVDLNELKQQYMASLFASSEFQTLANKSYSGAAEQNFIQALYSRLGTATVTPNILQLAHINIAKYGKRAFALALIKVTPSALSSQPLSTTAAAIAQNVSSLH